MATNLCHTLNAGKLTTAILFTVQAADRARAHAAPAGRATPVGAGPA